MATRKEQREAAEKARLEEVEAFLKSYPTRFAQLLHEYHTLPGFSVQRSQSTAGAWQFRCANGWDSQNFFLPLSADAVDYNYIWEFETAERYVAEYYKIEKEIQEQKALFEVAHAKIKAALTVEEFKTLTVLRVPTAHETARAREESFE